MSMPTIPSTPRRRRWRVWLLLLPALLTAAGIGAQQFLGSDADTSYRTATVEKGDLAQTVTAMGSLQAKEYVDVGTQVSGRVEQIHVEIGDRVRQDQLIAEIDPTVYEFTVSKDRANLANLQAQAEQKAAELELSVLQLARNRRILAAKAVSQDTVDQAAATVKVRRAELAAIRAQIAAAKATLEGDLANLGYTKIYAPMAGTVVSQTTVSGQTVNASQSAPVIVQVADLDTMTVWAQVAEADVSKLQPGMSAYFTTLGMPERRWQGRVRQVQPTPTVVNDVVLYNVLIDVDNSEQLLLPQMTVQVFFLLGQTKGAALVPMSALRPDREAGADRYRALVLGDQGPVERHVQVGLSNRTSAEVLAGLAVGERVVLPQQAESPSRAGLAGRLTSMGPRL